MNVLITGGLGFLGSNLAQFLVKKGHRVTVYDASIEGLGANNFNVHSIKEKITILKKDVRNTKAIAHAVKKKDIIFHFAGQVDHHRSIEKPFEDVDMRINGTLSLLEAVRIHNPKAKIVFSSTRAVYGKTSGKTNEETQTNPLGMYAITSLACEKILLMYQRLYGIRCSIARVTNTYGPRHQMNKHSGVVNVFIKQALEGKPITLMGKGKVHRDILFVNDACEAFWAIAKTNTKNCVFNIGTGKSISLATLAKEIADQTCTQIIQVPTPKTTEQIEPGDYHANVSRITRETKWKAKTSLKEGIRKTLTFYAEHQDHYW